MLATACTVLLSSAAPCHARWKGHELEGAVVLDLAVVSSEPETLYAGTAGGGLFKTTDGGTRWFRRGPFRAQAVRSIAIDPADPSTIYVSASRGLYRSPDAGGSWSHLSSFPGYAPSAVIPHPTVPETLFAIGSGDLARRVYRSDDSGSSWFAIDAGLPELFGTIGVEQLVFDSGSPPTLFALVDFAHTGVFKLAGDGVSWERADAGLVGLGSPIEKLRAHPTAPGTLLLAVHGGLYRTTNAGASWEELDLGIAFDWVYDVAVARTEPTTVYAATLEGLLRSTDDGAHWSLLPATGAPRLYGATILVEPDDSGVAYLGSNGPGVFKSTDAGNTWTSASSGLNAGSVQSIAVDRNDPDRVIAGTSNGVFHSENRGRTWVQSPDLRSADVQTVLIAPSNPARMYAAVPLRGVFVSDDGGDTWARRLTGFLDGLALDPNAPLTLYAGGRVGPNERMGVFKTRDGGETWDGYKLPASIDDFPSVLAVAPSAPKTIYVGTRGDGLLRSNDGGKRWRPAGPPLGGGFADISLLAIHPTDRRTVISATAFSMWRTSDAGATWSPLVEEGFWDVAITFDPDTPTTLYSGGYQGVRHSTDGGLTWEKMNRGLRGHAVASITVDPTNTSRLYAGTAGGGVFVWTEP